MHSADEAQETSLSVPAAGSLATFHAVLPPVGFVEVTTLPTASTATHSDADGQDTASRVFVPSIVARVHAVAPPVGFVELSRCPELSTATHSEIEGQERVRTLLRKPVLGSMLADVQVVLESPGLVEVRTFPALSAATHRVVDGHETLSIALGWSTSKPVVAFHADGPPLGVVDVSRLPCRSPATHSEVLGHEMPDRTAYALPTEGNGSICATVHELDVLAGLLEVTALPCWSTAAHRVVVGQEMWLSAVEVSTGVTVQAEVPPVGFEEATTFPALSPPTHSDDAGHEIALNALVPMLLVTHALDPPVGFVAVTTLPALSTAAHKLDVGQDSAVMAEAGALSICPCCVQSDALPLGLEVVQPLRPAVATQKLADAHETALMIVPEVAPRCALVHVAVVGLAELQTFPDPSPATQREVEGQEIDQNTLPGSTVDDVQVEAPAAGLVELITFPLASTATHSDDAGAQETAWMKLCPGRNDSFQALAPPVGSVEVSIAPLLLNATQSEAEAHDTALKKPLATGVVCQADVPPVGFVEVTTSPAPSTATQSDVEGHETPRIGCASGCRSIWLGADQASGESASASPGASATMPELQTVRPNAQSQRGRLAARRPG